MNFIKLFLAITLFFLSANSFAGPTIALPTPTAIAPIPDEKLEREDKKKLKEARDHFDNGAYLKALPLYEELSNKYPEMLTLKYMTGICYLYKPDEHDKSVQLLEEIIKAEPEFNEARYYLGTAYHITYQFDKAIEQLNTFKSNTDMLIDSERAMIDRYIHYCENGKELVNTPAKVKIVNLGSPVSTEGAEYKPLISPDESTLLFTYRGPKCTGGKMDIKGKPDENGSYYEDILVTYRKDSLWTTPQSIADNINTTGHDAALSLSVDGQKMLVYKSDKNKSEDIYMSILQGTDWTRPKPLEGEVNSKYWEGSGCLAGDGRTIYFSSDRPDGFGGRDLYKATLQNDGSWMNVKNLGPAINTPNNEDAPFMHPNGKTLYFSSEGHNSMGGYDIFYSHLDENNLWKLPVNLGYPINTTSDDKYYVVSGDGHNGYFSSARDGGNGQYDIYKVTPGTRGEAPVLALAIGKVLLDETPAKSTIKLRNKETDEIEGLFSSNSVSGEYTIPVVPGKHYELSIEVENEEVYNEDIDVAKTLDTYVHVNHDFTTYSETYMEVVNVDTNRIIPLNDKIEVSILRKQLNAFKETTEEEEDTVISEDAISTVKTDSTHLAKASPSDTTNREKEPELSSEEVTMAPSDNSQNIEATVPEDSSGIEEETATLAAQEKEPKDTAASPQLVAENDTAKSASSDSTDTTTNEEALATASDNEEDSSSPSEKQEASASSNNLSASADPDTRCPDEDQYIDFSAFIGKDLNDTTHYNALVRTGGDYCTEGLVFKVQIGAYRHPENFKYPYLSEFGEAEITDYPDGITRFTMGSHITLGEAEVLRQEIIEAGQEDAWVTPFYEGNRMLMHELIEANFYSKRIN